MYLLETARGLRVAFFGVASVASVLVGLWSADAIAQTVVRLSPTGPQPTVVTPQGKTRALYRESHALLISVANYSGASGQGWRKLAHTTNEVDRLAESLRRHGFNIWRVSDPTGAELRGVLRDFIAEYGGPTDNRLLFFFSGHGYTNPNNDFGYLVPVDSRNPSTSFPAFQRTALPIAEIELLAKEIEARHAIFLFDSCFSGTIFTSKANSPVPLARGGDAEDRWRFLTGSASKPVRQFISAGGPKEELPAKSVFLPLLLRALDGEATGARDGYVTGKEIGLWLEQTVPSFNRSQNPQSSVIRVPDLAFGDVVFQYDAARRVSAPSSSLPAPPRIEGPAAGAAAGAAAAAAAASAAVAPLRPLGATGATKPIPLGTKVTYAADIFFAVDKAVLSAEGRAKLDDLARKLSVIRTEVIIAVGSADRSEGDNAQRIAMRRAEAVKAALVASGLEANRIYVEATVRDGAASPAERAQRRRVEIEAVGTKGT